MKDIVSHRQGFVEGVVYSAENMMAGKSAVLLNKERKFRMRVEAHLHSTQPFFLPAPAGA
jgi:hypothetical protein